MSPSPSYSHTYAVYWEDTDAGGVVYYANYLKFMERCRTEWLRVMGIDQMRLLLVGGKHFFRGGAPGGVARVRIVESDLEEIALGREWGAELMGGVGNEVLLGGKRTFESREEAIEGVAELLELVLRTGKGQTLVEAGR